MVVVFAREVYFGFEGFGGGVGGCGPGEGGEGVPKGVGEDSGWEVKVEG